MISSIRKGLLLTLFVSFCFTVTADTLATVATASQPTVVSPQHGDNVPVDNVTAEELLWQKTSAKLKRIQRRVYRFLDNFSLLDSVELVKGVNIERRSRNNGPKVNSTENQRPYELLKQPNDARLLTNSFGHSNDDNTFEARMLNYADTHYVSINLPRAYETGRLLFFKGLKKVMWPLFIGAQVAKTVLLALFLPSIIGSIGKMVGKGLTSVSGYARPAETVDDLDFKDNSFNGGAEGYPPSDYAFGQADSSQTNFATQMYDAALSNNHQSGNTQGMNINGINAMANSRFGSGGQRVTYINSPADNYYSKSTNSMMATGKRDDFRVFHDIPASSLLLTNYDPFYSPLLSRLDAVFQQLALGAGDEKCREKLVCLMYASPAKYAPYSNLVSAQLSRELNELKKPTTDNPDILRFFKYMRAAKDGQDGVNCEISFRECINYKETENPAMLTTYNDINKLVGARKF